MVLRIVLAAAVGALILAPTASMAAGNRTVTKVGNTAVVSDDGGWLATFTSGARTVTLRGGSRTLSEPNVAATVTSGVRVRLLPVPFSGTVDNVWLDETLASRSPDLLDLSLQYIAGSLDVYNAGSVRIAGDAKYASGADFNDYLGLTWGYVSSDRRTTTDSPESSEYGSTDCTGYVRLVFGYRGGYPLTTDRYADGVGIPRTPGAMATSGPGAVIVADRGVQAQVDASIRPGDIVFFDANTSDGKAIDHVGIYLGRDSNGRARFISSRRTPDGPTMGDVGGASVIDGTGYYATGFRSVRRF
jgi:hypothetical protein